MQQNPRRPDEDLVLAAAGGDGPAFEDLVRRHARGVLSLLTRMVGDVDQAQDLSQEVWVKVHGALHRFRPGAPFRPWLYTITANRARDHGRRRRETVLSLDDVPIPPPEPRGVDPASAMGERAMIRDVLSRVPEPFGTALELVDVQGLSYEEAAGALECAVGTVKSRVNRGRLAFRDHYIRLNGGSPFEEEEDALAPPVTRRVTGNRRY